MSDLTLTSHTHIRGEIVNAVLSRGDDSRAFVFTSADPLPARRIEYSDPNRRYNDHSSAQWVQDSPTFTAVKRVNHWGWLRRIAQGYSEPGLVHPHAGCAFEIIQWRYGKARHLGMNGTGPLYAHHERFNPIIIARLSDGRWFADQWADPSVMYDSLSRWRNAQGYLCSWQGIGFDVTAAIGGLDWKSISDHQTAYLARRRRELEIAS